MEKLIEYKILLNYLSVIVNNKDIDICEIPDILDLDSFITILNEKINKLQIIKNS